MTASDVFNKQSCHKVQLINADTSVLIIITWDFPFNSNLSFSRWFVKSWQGLGFYLSITHTSTPAHSWVYFIQSKAAFLVFFLLFCEFIFTLGRVYTQRSPSEKKRRSITVNDHQALFWFQPKQRASMTFTFVLSECIWRANISKHEIQMSICTVTQTMKWLHVAAGRRPAAREWSAGEGASTNISGLFFFSFFSTEFLWNPVALWW